MGQGIAGTVIAFKLLQQKQDVHLIDNFHQNSSSKVAAGLYNPLVFKWITKSWNAKVHLKSALSTYQQIEELLQSKYLHPSPIYRIIASEQEFNQWTRRENQEDYKEFIYPCENQIEQTWDKGFGNRGVAGSGWLDLKKMLVDFREYLRSENRITEEKIDFSKLNIDGPVKYKGKEYTNVICCEGAAAVTNPFFNTQIFKPAKGEVLEIESEDLQLDKVLNYGQFIIPLGGNKYKVGTNFDWQDLTSNPTEKIKNESIASFKKFFNKNPKVVEHSAAIRPSTVDRKPLIGRSKIDSRICIFNGLGSKGVLLAPWMAEHLINHILNGKSINSEIDANRQLD